MRKILVILSLFVLITLTGCNNVIKEYKANKIIKFSYISVDYNGGYTEEKVLDFNDNKYYSVSYLPLDDNKHKLEFKNTFTDEEEKVFINQCYSYGWLDLNFILAIIGMRT